MAGYGGPAAGAPIAWFTEANGANGAPAPRRSVLRTQDIAYAWEQAYERSWEAVEEDEEGRLKAPVTEAALHRSRRAKAPVASVKRGMIRYLFLVIDMSKHAALTDMRPSRRAAMLNVARTFIRDFFDQNPLSYMGIISTQDAVAHRVVELTSSRETLLQALDHLTQTRGEVSFRHMLRVASGYLELIPAYGTREVLFLQASTSTCDDGDLFVDIDTMKTKKIRISVVSVSAEMYAAKAMTQISGGTYAVALTDLHFKELVLKHCQPPPLAVTDAEANKAQLVFMGFPKLTDVEAGWCACHNTVCTQGYECPQCHCIACDIPCLCSVCGLSLISSSKLARSYHHLFPVPVYTEVAAPTSEHAMCFGCMASLGARDLQVKCPTCDNLFCGRCDAFIHESLHNCPGCLAS